MVIKKRWQVVSGTMSALIIGAPAKALAEHGTFDLDDFDEIPTTYSHTGFDEVRFLQKVAAGESVSLLSALSASAEGDSVDLTTFESLNSFDSVPSDSVPSDSVPSESVASDSVPSESVPSESVASESVPSESVASESVASESVPSVDSVDD